MEYHPQGDLHRYLNSPLPEKEGQDIVFQILEGLQFMHDNGFAHRDLKPKNLLVVCKGPDWWVKIADFGISKRAADGLTALHTTTGTPAFMAPEVTPYFRAAEISNDPYTKAVDVWSLGVITFLILTGETLFKDLSRLGRYIAGTFTFPVSTLLANQVSEQGCDFVRSSMMLKPEDRPSVKDCLHYPWLNSFTETPETQRCDLSQTENENSSYSEKSTSSELPRLSLNVSQTQPSASWSTLEQIPTSKIHRSLALNAGRPKAVTASKSPLQSLDVSELEASASRSSVEEIPIPKIHRSLAVTAERPKIAPTHDKASRSQITTDINWEANPRKLIGHTKSISALAFSPNGKQMASGSFDATVRLRDAITGEILNTLECHTSTVRAVAYSPDGEELASSAIQEVILWQSVTGARLRTFVLDVSVIDDTFVSMAFSPTEKQVAFLYYDTIIIRDLMTGAALRQLEIALFSRAIAFSPDGKLIASASDDETVKIWDLVTGALRTTLRDRSGSVSITVTALTFSPSGEQLASASDQGTIKVWHPITRKDPKTLSGLSGAVNSIAFSPKDETILASLSCDGTVRIWNLLTGTTNSVFSDRCWLGTKIRVVAFSPNGGQFATACELMIELWNMETKMILPEDNQDLKLGEDEDIAKKKKSL